MKPRITIAYALTLLALGGFVHAAPPSVNPEAPEIDISTQAKIMKEGAKTNPSAMPAGNSVAGGSSSSNCGQVNIGNTQNKGPVGNIIGGASVLGGQTVVVKGDVINTANCK